MTDKFAIDKNATEEANIEANIDKQDSVVKSRDSDNKEQITYGTTDWILRGLRLRNKIKAMD